MSLRLDLAGAAMAALALILSDVTTRAPPPISAKACRRGVAITPMAGSITILPAVACQIQTRRLTAPRGVAVRGMEKQEVGHGAFRTEPQPRTVPLQHAIDTVRK